jgi:hypothetical protein
MPSKMLSTTTALLLWLFQVPYLWQSVTATATATATAADDTDIQKESESPFSIVSILMYFSVLLNVIYFHWVQVEGEVVHS